MDFELPQEIKDKLAEIDAFNEREIKPLERENIQFFDYRREYARTDWERDGQPREEWNALIAEMERRADKAGLLRLGLPKGVPGGGGASNLMIAAIREHLAGQGLQLANDLQDESSVVGNFPIVPVLHEYGSPAQQQYVEGIIGRENHLAFALTEPDHGSDATHISTTAHRQGDVWVINGQKRYNSQVYRAKADLIFARTSGKAGDAEGITAFIVPMSTPGIDILYNHWTFNMPSDHPEVGLVDVRVGDEAILGGEGKGLHIAQRFIHENRIRQAAASTGAARYCIEQAVKYANERQVFGQSLSKNQIIQFQLAELYAEVEMLRNYVFRTAWEMDHRSPLEISDKVSICNFKANRLVCAAADRAIQVHGGMGYTRACPFEHIYRHHRRYRITEGSEEIQIRRVAQYLFGFGRAKGTSRG